MTCRLFIDEVGNSDLQGSATDDNIRYLSLTGIITKRSAHDTLFQPTIDNLKERFFGHSASNPVILHRREIMRGEGAFHVLKDPEVRESFNTELLDLLERLPYIAMTVTIDKREHLARYNTWRFDPYHYCLRCLIERYTLWLKRQKLTGDVGIEPRYKQGDKRVKASFQLIYDTGSDNIAASLFQKHLTSREIKFFPKQQNVAAIQIVDSLAHPSHRSMKLEREGILIPPDFGTKVTDILYAKKYSRNPLNQVIDGWGRKWLP